MPIEWGTIDLKNGQLHYFVYFIGDYCEACFDKSLFKKVFFLIL